MTKLTTHVLDVYSGKPGKGIKVELYNIKNGKREKLNSTILNNDGRTDKPLIEGTNFQEGQYEIVFFVGNYFNQTFLNSLQVCSKTLIQACDVQVLI